MVLTSLQQYKEAIVEFNKAIKINPNFEKTYLKK
jgi:tetratricopeptide (TPR) repeat protein